MSENITDRNATGVFGATLKRNNKQIRDDRAQAIIEDTEVVYRRRVEDIATKIKRKQRDQEAMLDLSPDNALSLAPNLKNYDPDKFVTEHEAAGLALRDLDIQYEEAKKGYEHLFGSFAGSSNE